MSREAEVKPRGLTRRRFLAESSAFVVGASAAAAAPALGASSRKPETVAILATKVAKYSHAQHFIDRFLEGYGWHGRHHRPPLKLVSLYVDQFPENDLARERSRRHGVPIYSSIPEALTRGGKRLAVDGVLVIAEHGEYPKNEKGQKLYPRYQFFKQVVKVFEESGRSVPVFNDKHLSTDWDECAGMVEDSRRLGFPFLAGSSLPVTWRLPSIEMPLGTELTESVSVCYGGIDSYDIHGLETAQCMSERRLGGEAGIRSVQALKGGAVWEALAQRESTRKLLFAALSRSHTLAAPEGFTAMPPPPESLARMCPEPIVYFVEHRDGFKTAMFMLNGAVRDFTYAGLKQDGETISCQMHLPMPPRYTTLADFFNPLVNNIEQMILTGKAPYPVERTLLTSGMTLAGVESLHRGQEVVPTPRMGIEYAAPVESTFWRA